MKKKKTVLVTGGSGFLGNHLVKALLRKGYNVRILDIRKPDKSVINDVDFRQVDVRDFKKVADVVDGMEIVFHTLAVIPMSKAGKGFNDINYGGTRNVLEASLKKKVRKVVHISSSAVYRIPEKGDVIDENFSIKPVGIYGKSKWKAETACFEYIKKGLPITIIRPRTILGTERLGIFSILFEWIKNDKKVFMLGSGNNLFSYISIDDLVDACIKAEDKGNNMVFNIGNDDYGTMKDDIYELIKYAKSKSEVVPLNAAFVRFMLKLLDIVKLSPFSDWHYQTIDKEYVFDLTRAKKILSWKPKDSNKKILRETYDWYLKNYKNVKIGTSHKFAPSKRLIKIMEYF